MIKTPQIQTTNSTNGHESIWQGIARCAPGANTTAISILAESWQKGHAGCMPQSEMEIPRRRRSACADAALRAELERIVRMTIEERVKAALSMQELFAWLNPTAKTQ